MKNNNKTTIKKQRKDKENMILSLLFKFNSRDVDPIVHCGRTNRSIAPSMLGCTTCLTLLV